MLKAEQASLFGQRALTASLRGDYEPLRPAHFEVARICLAKNTVTMGLK